MIRIRHLIGLLVIFASVLLFTNPGFAATLFDPFDPYDLSGNWGTHSGLYTLGVEFSVGSSDMEVTGLGYFDFGGDGLSDPGPSHRETIFPKW